MTATPLSTSPRRGFTLVELLVAMALIIFIMVILTEAFTAGTGVFRTLKAQGDMQEKLRATVSLLRDDLRQTPGKQVHFGETDPPFLSTLGLFNNPSVPRNGYFYIQQPPQQFLPLAMQFGSMPEGPQTPQGPEAVDTFSIRMNSPMCQLNGPNVVVAGPNSGAAPTAFLPALCFTLNKEGTQPQDYFAARIPGVTASLATPLSATEQQFFAIKPVDYQQPAVRAAPTTQSGLLLSQWAEVGYFLVPTGRTAGTTTPMPTYSLRRRLRVVLNDTATTTLVNTGPARIPAALWGPRYAEVSCYPDTSTGSTVLYFNTPKDLTNPPQPTAAPGLPPCNAPPAPKQPPAGCQVLVPPLSPVPVPGQQTLPPWPQPSQQSLVPLGTGAQGQPDWTGDDIILTDVISFNVRVLALSRTTGLYSSDFLDLTDPALVALGLKTPGFYNTGDNPNFTITALEISIRVWDTKTSQTRQVTFIQDM